METRESPQGKDRPEETGVPQNQGLSSLSLVDYLISGECCDM